MMLWDRFVLEWCLLLLIVNENRELRVKVKWGPRKLSLLADIRVDFSDNLTGPLI